MPVFYRRCLVIILVLLITGLIAKNYPNVILLEQPVIRTRNAQNIPMRIGDWKGQETELDLSCFEKQLETTDIISRRYVNSAGEGVTCMVVYGIVESIHQPTLCMRGSGWAIKATQTLPIHPGGGKNKEIRVNKVLLQRGQQQNIVIYWFKMKDDFMSSHKLLQLRFFLNHFSFRASSNAARIDVYSPVINGDEKGATEKAKVFAEELMPILSQSLP